MLWRSQEGMYESVVDVLDAEKLILLTRKESQTAVPNYYIKNLKAKIVKPLGTQGDSKMRDFNVIAILILHAQRRAHFSAPLPSHSLLDILSTTTHAHTPSSSCEARTS